MRAARSMWIWKWPFGGLVLVGGGLLGANLLLTALLGLLSGAVPTIPRRVTEAALAGLFVPWIALHAATLGTALVALVAAPIQALGWQRGLLWVALAILAASKLVALGIRAPF